MYRLPNPVECEYDIDCAPDVCDISTFKCVPASFAPAAPGPSYGRGPTTGSPPCIPPCPPGHTCIDGICMAGGFAAQPAPATLRQVRKAQRALKYARAMNPLPPKPPPCPEGYQWAWSIEKGNHCLPDTITHTGTGPHGGGHAPPACPEGYRYDARSDTCVPAGQYSAATPTQLKPTCPIGYVLQWSSSLGYYCKKRSTITHTGTGPGGGGHAPPACPEGYRYDAHSDTCVPAGQYSATAPPGARPARLKRKKPTSRYNKLAKIFGSTQARRSTSRRALVGGAGPQAAGVCPPGQVVCGTSYPGDPPICCPAPSGGGTGSWYDPKLGVYWDDPEPHQG